MARPTSLLLTLSLVLPTWGCGSATGHVNGGGDAGNVPPASDTSLAAGDVFDVRVYGQEELSGQYRVEDGGTIDFPLVGRIDVAGLEPPEVADAIARSLADRDLLVDPQVSIFVREYNSRRVSVTGSVNRPGTFAMTPGMTVVQAVSQAGGLTGLANGNAAVVSRRTEEGLRRFPVRLDDISRGRATDFALQAGDIVFVPQRVF